MSQTVIHPHSLWPLNSLQHSQPQDYPVHSNEYGSGLFHTWKYNHIRWYGVDPDLPSTGIPQGFVLGLLLFSLITWSYPHMDFYTMDDTQFIISSTLWHTCACTDLSISDRHLIIDGISSAETKSQWDWAALHHWRCIPILWSPWTKPQTWI